MPTIIPLQRKPLGHQAAEILRGQIEQGAWEKWLPGERALGEMLQVSRNTVRIALRQLRKDGVIASEKNVGNKVIIRRRKKAGAAATAGLLVCDEFYWLRPIHILWIDQLRTMLAARGTHLHLLNGHAYARRNPAQALKKFTQMHPHSCWILLFSGEAVQSWFQKNAIPCIVAGSVYEGIDMPYCDVDHRAACRHAAGQLLRRGHRCITLLIKRSRWAGDILSETGFKEAFAHSGITDALPVIRHYIDTAEGMGIAEAVGQLMAQKTPPTALLVDDSFHCLTVIGCLNKLGLDVPRDVSVISRVRESCHNYMFPRLAGYTSNPRQFARALLGAITPALNGGPLPVRAHYIMPDFTEGGTVSSPPGKSSSNIYRNTKT